MPRATYHGDACPEDARAPSRVRSARDTAAAPRGTSQTRPREINAYAAAPVAGTFSHASYAYADAAVVTCAAELFVATRTPKMPSSARE